MRVKGEEVRAAEIVAALCLATDLRMGLPFEHGLHRTVAAMRLASCLGVDTATASDTYYVSLLIYSGCVADSEQTFELFRGGLTKHFIPLMHGTPRQAAAGLMRAIPDPGSAAPARVAQTLRRLPQAARMGRQHPRALCEVGEMLAGRLGLSGSTQAAFTSLTERWDGRGRIQGKKATEIPQALRIAHVAGDAVLQRFLHGAESALEIVRERAGGSFDPDIVQCLSDNAAEILAGEPDPAAWEAALDAEPRPWRMLAGDRIDQALSAIGDFSDLMSPYLTGHSSGVAALAAAAATQCGWEAPEVARVRRAGLVHDVGRVAVDPAVWEWRSELSADQWEQVRLHPYHTERILSRSPFLSSLVPLAGAHHERLDGSGYHRGSKAPALEVGARILAAADAFHAMTEPRPYRGPLSGAEAAEHLGGQVNDGRLDPDAVAAVLSASGEEVPSLQRPAGLTDRETAVLALLARGQQTKQIAGALGISPKTADRHIQHTYSKIGVSTRAAATLFAMEHGLVAWGEFPMAGSPARP